jgi:hypothetical protein
MSKQLSISPERVKQVLDYDPDTGVFVRKIKTGPTARIGVPTGCYDSKGRLQIKIDGIAMFGHRLAWMHFYGEVPSSEIDHIDGNNKNNSIANLRLCSRTENCANTKIKSTNTSGYKGVSLHSATGKWRADIMHKGQKHFLGLFECKEAAAMAYAETALRLNGEFAKDTGVL